MVFWDLDPRGKGVLVMGVLQDLGGVSGNFVQGSLEGFTHDSHGGALRRIL